MPLNDDPNAVSDDDYDQLIADLGDPVPCPVAVPADVLAESLARLDAAL